MAGNKGGAIYWGSTTGKLFSMLSDDIELNRSRSFTFSHGTVPEAPTEYPAEKLRYSSLGHLASGSHHFMTPIVQISKRGNDSHLIPQMPQTP
jgi:hypothetical protein